MLSISITLSLKHRFDTLVTNLLSISSGITTFLLFPIYDVISILPSSNIEYSKSDVTSAALTPIGIAPKRKKTAKNIDNDRKIVFFINILLFDFILNL